MRLIDRKFLRAFVLFELFAVFIVIAVMLGVVVGSVVSVQKALAATIQRAAIEEAWTELSGKVRDDIRSAKNVVWLGSESAGTNGTAQRLLITLDSGRTVEYANAALLPLELAPDTSPPAATPAPQKRTARKPKPAPAAAPTPQTKALPTPPQMLNAAMQNPDSAFRYLLRRENSAVTLHARGFDLVSAQMANGSELWKLADLAKNKDVNAAEVKFLLLTFEYRRPGAAPQRFQTGAAIRMEQKL